MSTPRSAAGSPEPVLVFSAGDPAPASASRVDDAFAEVAAAWRCSMNGSKAPMSFGCALTPGCIVYAPSIAALIDIEPKSKMRPTMIESQVRKFQTLLERKIHQRGHEESDVEEDLGWEAGTIRRLLTGKEELGVRQVLAILGVIDVDPKAFFAELYGLTVGGLSADVAELKNMVGSVANLLVKNGVVTADELMNAVAAQAAETGPPGEQSTTGDTV